MKHIILITLVYCFCVVNATQAQQDHSPNYSFNRKPLKTDTYVQLPLGSIKAKGWLLKQLELQKDGFTGHAEELYPGKDDLGKDADWLGGTGKSWEKAPYYLKGLVALAYTLDDKNLKDKAKSGWIIHYNISRKMDFSARQTCRTGGQECLLCMPYKATMKLLMIKE
ncbi:hypothetical protein ACVWYN_000606 [Pedobacter sp. UYP24]